MEGKETLTAWKRLQNYLSRKENDIGVSQEREEHSGAWAVGQRIARGFREIQYPMRADPESILTGMY